MGHPLSPNLPTKKCPSALPRKCHDPHTIFFFIFGPLGGVGGGHTYSCSFNSYIILYTDSDTHLITWRRLGVRQSKINVHFAVTFASFVLLLSRLMKKYCYISWIHTEKKLTRIARTRKPTGPVETLNFPRSVTIMAFCVLCRSACSLFSRADRVFHVPDCFSTLQPWFWRKMKSNRALSPPLASLTARPPQQPRWWWQGRVQTAPSRLAPIGATTDIWRKNPHIACADLPTNEYNFVKSYPHTTLLTSDGARFLPDPELLLLLLALATIASIPLDPPWLLFSSR